MEIIEMTEVVTIDVDTRLDVIVSQAGLGHTDVIECSNSYSPFLQGLARIRQDAQKINWENPSILDEKIARECRLATVKVRTGTSDVKDNRKRIHVLRGNVEQSAYNLIKDDCFLDEEKYLQVEKRREIQEKNRIQELLIERIGIIGTYEEFIPLGISLGEMSEEDFGKLLTGAKLQYQAKVEADKKAEQDRIEKERQEAVEKERIRLENVKLKQAAEEREAEIKAERAKAEAKAKKEREASEKKLAAEKAKADEARKIAELKAAKERAVIEAKLEAEREAREKIEAEAMAKKMAENKAKKDAEAKAAKEAKDKAIADKKAAAAPDKEKLVNLVQKFQAISYPRLKTDEAKELLSEFIRNVNHAHITLLARINEL